MANKNMKKRSTLYAIREIQMKTRMRYTTCLLGCPESETLTTSNIWNTWNNVASQQPSFIASKNEKWYSHSGRHFGSFCKIKHTVTTQSTLLGIYSKDLKSYVHTKTCTRVFIATLLIIAKTRRQSRCPSVGEWVSYSRTRQWNIIQH